MTTPVKQKSENYADAASPSSLGRRSSFGTLRETPRSKRPMPRASVATFVPPEKNRDRSIWMQINVLILKRFKEFVVKRFLVLSYALVPILISVFIVLLYYIFPNASGSSFNGYLEEYFFPFCSWIYISNTVTTIVRQKPMKAQLKQSGLFDISYWIANVVTEGIVVGLGTAIILAIISIAGLFNEARFVFVLVFLGVYYASAMSFSFFISSFSDSTQVATEFVTLILVGFYGLFYGMDLPHRNHFEQHFCCLFPQLALQLGARSFTDGYDGIPIANICAIMIIDIYIYGAAAWYCNQVLPSQFNNRKPFHFFLHPSFWFPDQYSPSPHLSFKEIESVYVKNIEQEDVNEAVTGRATVIATSLKKTFPRDFLSRYTATDWTAQDNDCIGCTGVDFKLYSGQIVAIVGRNGCGKSTIMKILSGVINPDSGYARVYDNSLIYQMSQIQGLLGVCPQEPQFFEFLTVIEHLELYSRLKGFGDVSSQELLLKSLGLEGRNTHRPSELSESQRRKLAIATALCGSSKFLVLDAPFCGMDLTSKRQLWKLLKEMKKDRTILFTAQNIDDVDAIADRVFVMDSGSFICSGSLGYLRAKYSYHYIIVCEVSKMDSPRLFESLLADITLFIEKHLREANFEKHVKGGLSDQLHFSVSEVEHKEILIEFLALFESKFMKSVPSVLSCDLRKSSMTDLFGKIVPSPLGTELQSDEYLVAVDCGKDVNTNRYPWLQSTTAMIIRKLLFSARDYVSITMVVYQWLVFLLAGGLAYNLTEYSDTPFPTGLIRYNGIICALYVVAYITVPGNLAHFVVKDREDGTKHLILLAGCPISSYWFGIFVADFIVLCLPIAGLFASWAFTGMESLWPDTLSSWVCFVVMIVFTINLVSFSHLTSFLFEKHAAASSHLPIVLIGVHLFAAFMLLAVAAVSHENNFFGFIADYDAIGIVLWIVTFLSPHGAMFAGLLHATSADSMHANLINYPTSAATCVVMACEAVVYFLIIILTDSSNLLGKKSRANNALSASGKTVSNVVVDQVSVQAEKARVADYMQSISGSTKRANFSPASPIKPYLSAQEVEDGRRIAVDYLPAMSSDSKAFDVNPIASLNNNNDAIAICVNKLMLQFPKKTRHMDSFGANIRGQITGVEDVSFAVNRGEIFGLVGANCSGKSSFLASQLRRLLSEEHNCSIGGDFLIEGVSLFDDLGTVIRLRVGYVADKIVLWDWMTSFEHLQLFARMVGLFETESGINYAVQAILQDFELFPDRNVLTSYLSTGVRRKLCLAIAVMINPRVLLLESISDVLDPWSRSKIYDILHVAMKTRTTIVATSDGGDAEVLCSRVGFLIDGRLSACGLKKDLKERLSWGSVCTLQMSARTEKADIEFVSKKFHDMFRSSHLLSIDKESNTVSFCISTHELDIDMIFKRLKYDKIFLENISLVHPTLEQVFLHLLLGDGQGKRAFSKYLEEGWNRYITGESDEYTEVVKGELTVIDQNCLQITASCIEDIKYNVLVCITCDFCSCCTGCCNCGCPSCFGDCCSACGSFVGFEDYNSSSMRLLTEEEVLCLIGKDEQIDLSEFIVRLIVNNIITIPIGHIIDRRRDFDPWIDIFHVASRTKLTINRTDLLWWRMERQRLFNKLSNSVAVKQSLSSCRRCSSCRECGGYVDDCFVSCKGSISSASHNCSQIFSCSCSLPRNPSCNICPESSDESDELELIPMRLQFD